MKYNKLTPNLAVSDVSRSLAFYVDTLGFTRTMTVPEQEPFIFAGVVKDGVEVFLNDIKLVFSDKPAGTSQQLGGWGISLYLEVENVDALYTDLKAKNVKIVNEPMTQFYGMREFIISDPDGVMLIFAT